MRAITIVANLRCPLKCRHCGAGLSEINGGRRGAMRPKILREIIRSTDPAIYSGVVLTGGEPSLNPELIVVGIEECSKAGLRCGTVSAPIWARSDMSAEVFLSKVTGLDSLILSYDQFHLEFLTFEHYRNAAIKAVEKGVKVVVAITYINEQDRRRQLGSLAAIRQYISDIIFRRVVPIGNAAQLESGETEQVLVEGESDLDTIPRGCLIGTVSVDNELGLHGCCWSRNSPFSLVPIDGESLVERFRRLESNTLFQSMLHKGFLDSLSPLGRKYLVAAVKGRSFSSECHICLSTMEKGYEHIWAECVAGPRRRVKEATQPA